MSGGRGYEGGRTRMGTKVILNVYDLSPANDCLYSVGMGLHHSGVEILGREYSFASGGGIFDSSPKEAPGAQFREAIELGAFDGGSSELQSAISGEFIDSVLFLLDVVVCNVKMIFAQVAIDFCGKIISSQQKFTTQ